MCGCGCDSCDVVLTIFELFSLCSVKAIVVGSISIQTNELLLFSRY